MFYATKDPVSLVIYANVFDARSFRILKFSGSPIILNKYHCLIIYLLHVIISILLGFLTMGIAPCVGYRNARTDSTLANRWVDFRVLPDVPKSEMGRMVIHPEGQIYISKITFYCFISLRDR